MDFEKIKDQNRLAALLEGYQLKKVANTGGGELAGPCPFCGGRDRFRVQPANDIWLCRNCTGGQWRDVIDFIAKRDNLTIGQAAQKLSIGLTVSNEKPAARKPKAERQAYGPPPEAWQRKAREAAKKCQNTLYSEQGARALAYLEKRGFKHETLQRFGVGYSSGFTTGSLWIPQGITIPANIGGQLWYLKIRTNHAPKYTLVKGSKPAALFNADELETAKSCLVTEGEFNAMIATQEFGDLLPIASMGGSASNRIDLAAWGPYFMNKSLVLAVFDNDEAGDAGAVALYERLGYRVKLAALPMDLNAYFQAGESLREWAKERLGFYAIEP